MQSVLAKRKGSYVLVYVFVLGLGVLASYFSYATEDRQTRADMLARADVLAHLIDPSIIQKLAGEESDLSVPQYQKLKNYLESVHDTEPDMRFAYVMGEHTDGDIFFYADSEDPSSPDYSPPGQTYYEATPTLRNAFTTQKGTTEGPTPDRWGLWLSAYAPLFDTNGKFVAIFGLDLPASTYIHNVFFAALLPFLISVIGVLVLFIMRRVVH